jgi:hydroxyethylthiazole kinase
MDLQAVLSEVRLQQPLVHHITNWVTIGDCANVCKSFGASPVMAHAREEVTEMAGLASALVLNIGTLTTELVESMLLAGEVANRRNIPVVLDVCGSGATSFRDEACERILRQLRVEVIKGNASEIAKVAGCDVRTRGVDAGAVADDPGELARSLAHRRQAVVVVTGETDVVADAERTFRIANGHRLMAHLVGTGCMATSVIGTFAAVEPDLLKAAVAGLCCYEIAAEIAAEKSAGPGTFKMHLFDAVYQLKGEQVAAQQKVNQD